MKETLNPIPTNYWILKLRNQVKQIIKYLVSKQYKDKTFSYPLPPSLPSIQLIKNVPCTYTVVRLCWLTLC